MEAYTVLSEDFMQKASQCAFDLRCVDIVKKLARKIYTNGDIAYFVGKKDIPEELMKDKKIARLEGTILIVKQSDRQEVLKTVYKSRKTGLKRLRKRAN